MAPRSRHVFRSSFALAVYLVCTALVCSFIVFEVLDVEGSDRPSRPTEAMTVPLPEALHDIKRASLKGATLLWTDPAAADAYAFRETAAPPRWAGLDRVPPAFPQGRRIRTTPPRASPLAQPPSA